MRSMLQLARLHPKLLPHQERKTFRPRVLLLSLSEKRQGMGDTFANSAINCITLPGDYNSVIVYLPLILQSGLLNVYRNC